MVESLFTVGRVMGIHGEREVRSWEGHEDMNHIRARSLELFCCCVFAFSKKKKVLSLLQVQWLQRCCRDEYFFCDLVLTERCDDWRCTKHSGCRIMGVRKKEGKIFEDSEARMIAAKIPRV